MRAQGPALALLVVGVVVAVAVGFGRDEPASGPAPSTVAGQADAPVNFEGTFQVALTTTTRAAPFGGQGAPVQGETTLEAKITVRDDDGRLALSLFDVDEASVAINNEDALGDVARHALDGASITVSLDARGVTNAVVAESLDTGARRMLQLLATELAPVRTRVEGGARLDRGLSASIVWDVDRWICDDARCTQSERARTLVALKGMSLDGRTATVDGRATLTTERGAVVAHERTLNVTLTDADGTVRHVMETVLTVVRTTSTNGANTALHTRGTVAGPTAVIADVTDVPVSAGAEARMLDQRIGNLDRAALGAALDSAVETGAVVDHKAFLWQATGLLQRDPALTKDLVDRYDVPRATHAYRALVLDLLVGAGHKEAQAALVSLLESPASTRDPRHAMLFQRTALLAAPTDDTIAALERAAERPETRQVALIGLGAAAAARRAQGDDARAQALVGALTVAADRAETEPAVIAATLALGNSRHPMALAPLLKRAHANGANVRHAAAESLGKIIADDARRALVTLGKDVSSGVARRAFTSLRTQALDDDDFSVLTAAVNGAAIPDDALAELVTLVAATRDTDARARTVLEAIVARPHVNDRHVQARARQLLRP